MEKQTRGLAVHNYHTPLLHPQIHVASSSVAEGFLEVLSQQLDHIQLKVTKTYPGDF